ncbi:VOC family protein [Phenylobacterium sp. LjRoot225]|uniref:VOC family protein n=1 Tax=Phenylobacterium sp. LjRoot225 TaxID=3342285 RepID=UPI003ECF4E7A
MATDADMSKSIRATRVNHMNAVIENLDESVAHFRRLYGAELVVDLPQREWNACLIHVGRVIIELFAPHAFLLNARYGPHYLGVEYQADVDEVREVVAAHGVRLIRDIGAAVHTHPADCFGVAFEFYSGDFHERDWPLLDGPMKPPAFWRDEHPLGLTGLKGYTIAVEDIAAASAFLQSFLGAEAAYEAPRPAVSARAVGLQAADAVIELVTPVGDGVIERHLRRYGEGIRSTVFAVCDIERARRHFIAEGVDLVPGDSPGAFAVPAELNQGLMFEFSE